MSRISDEVNEIRRLLCLLIAGCDNRKEKVADVGEGIVHPQKFGKRDWNEHPPTTEFEELAFFYEAFQKSRNRAVLKNELKLHDKEGKVVAILKSGMIVHSPSMTDVDDTDLSENQRKKILFDLPAGAELLYLDERDSAILADTWYRNSASAPEEKALSEQDGADQPATSPKSQPEGGSNPEHKLEARPQ